MQELHDIDVEAYRDGWRKTVAEAIHAAFVADGVPLDEPRQIDLWARMKNPIHEYKVVLRPPS